jgi:hypothetical protein
MSTTKYNLPGRAVPDQETILALQQMIFEFESCGADLGDPDPKWELDDEYDLSYTVRKSEVIRHDVQGNFVTTRQGHLVETADNVFMTEG